MATTSEQSGLRSALSGVAQTAKQSLLVTMALFGVVLIVIGMTLLQGVYAGLFGIWGALLITAAAVGIVTVKLLKRL